MGPGLGRAELLNLAIDSREDATLRGMALHMLADDHAAATADECSALVQLFRTSLPLALRLRALRLLLAAGDQPRGRAGHRAPGRGWRRRPRPCCAELAACPARRPCSTASSSARFRPAGSRQDLHRAAAVSSVRWTCAQPAIASLIRSAAANPAWRVRAHALRLLNGCHAPWARSIIHAGCDDVDPRVRVRAVEVLGHESISSIEQSLLSARLRDGNGWVRAGALGALHRANRLDELDVLDALDDEFAPARRTGLLAALAVARQGPGSASLPRERGSGSRGSRVRRRSRVSGAGHRVDVSAGVSAITASRDTFARLRELVYERTGLYFDDRKRYFVERRMDQRIEAIGATSASDYYHLLRYGPDGEEFQEFVESLTTHETYFFREYPVLQAFADGALQRTLEQKRRTGDRSLRIWSAGCSTGEEPYTVAIILREVIDDFDRWQIELIGTDISRAVLRRARQATYGSRALKDVPTEYRNKYFRQDPRRWVGADTANYADGEVSPRQSPGCRGGARAWHAGFHLLSQCADLLRRCFTSPSSGPVLRRPGARWLHLSWPLGVRRADHHRLPGGQARR